MKKIFSLSENHNPNYVATICRITDLEPIENSDFLLKTVVNGFDIVVSWETKIGDVVIYFTNESAINLDFLGANNQFDIGNYFLNKNHKEVDELIENGDKDGAKKLCGFFNNKGRVKTITLRGCPSQGFVIPVSSLYKWKSDLTLITDWDQYINEPFDTVDGDLLVKKYVVKIKETPQPGKGKKKDNKLKRFDRLYEDQFVFHYDTNMLNMNMHKFSPDDDIVITRKKHGSSFISSNVLCNRKLSLYEKIKKFFGFHVETLEYGNVYSSRSVVKNRYINPTCGSYYDTDIWAWANEILKPYLTEGMTVYGEIYGYVPGSTKFIQKWHNYGCDEDPNSPKHTILMPYRITITDRVGNKTEWSVQEVYDWTVNLINNSGDDTLKNKIEPIEILYQGRFGDLYPDIDETTHWHENVLARMKVDTEHFNMEEDDPKCTKFLISGNGKKAKYFHAPIEGIVIRKLSDDGNHEPHAYKLKTQKHYEMEKVQHDNGDVDIEEVESEGGDA